MTQERLIAMVRRLADYLESANNLLKEHLDDDGDFADAEALVTEARAIAAHAEYDEEDRVIDAQTAELQRESDGWREDGDG